MASKSRDQNGVLEGLFMPLTDGVGVDHEFEGEKVQEIESSVEGFNNHKRKDAQLHMVDPAWREEAGNFDYVVDSAAAHVRKFYLDSDDSLNFHVPKGEELETRQYPRQGSSYRREVMDSLVEDVEDSLIDQFEENVEESICRVNNRHIHYGDEEFDEAVSIDQVVVTPENIEEGLIISEVSEEDIDLNILDVIEEDGGHQIDTFDKYGGSKYSGEPSKQDNVVFIEGLEGPSWRTDEEKEYLKEYLSDQASHFQSYDITNLV